MTLGVAFRHRLPGLVFDIAFEAPTPGTTVLFGPSGSGKSTAVAVVAGLLRPAWSRVAVDGLVRADTERGLFAPPERRHIGLVFQDARLFPHMSVLRNLTYGLHRGGRCFPRPCEPGASRAKQSRAPAGLLRRFAPRSDGWGRRAPHDPGQAIAFGDVVDLLGIGHLLDRRPHTLSGGERQRVAIGRALLSQPRLLVMDEPLASLDAARKNEILPYLVRLKTTLKLPILYVTHSLDEVARLADTLVLIEAGRSIAAGPLNEVATRSDLPFAARDDAGAILAMRLAAHDPARQLSRLAANGFSLWVPLAVAPVGAELRVRVPAREVILAIDAPRAISVQNIVEGTVRAVATDQTRHTSLVEIARGESRLLARVTPDAVTRLQLAPGRPVLALVKSTAIEVFPPADRPPRPAPGAEDKVAATVESKRVPEETR
jgi:molybdate transport system ATP-binding protein